MSEKLDMCELKMNLSSNRDIEELLFFTHSFNMALKASRMVAAKEKLQYVCTILCGKELGKLKTLCVQIEIRTMMHLN